MAKVPPHQAGFSIIEVMAAAMVLALTAAGASVLLINASSMKYFSDHRRQARMIVKELTEDPTHNYRNYNGLTTGTSDPGSPYRLDWTDNYSGIATTASVTVTEPATLTIQGTAGIPYKVVSSTLSWTENGTAASLTLRKILTRAQ